MEYRAWPGGRVDPYWSAHVGDYLRCYAGVQGMWVVKSKERRVQRKARGAGARRGVMRAEGWRG